MITNANWGHGSWLMKVLESAGFGHNVLVKPMTTYMEAESLEQLTELLMLTKAIFLPGWSDEEVEKFKPVLEEEITKLDAYEVVDGKARIGMLAAVGFAWK